MCSQYRYFSSAPAGTDKPKRSPKTNTKKPGFRDLQAKEIKNEQQRREQFEQAEASFQSLHEQIEKQERQGPKKRNKGRKSTHQDKDVIEKEEDIMENEQKVEYANQHNYFQLILDTYQSVKLLNSLDLGLLDESLSIFRENLFTYPDFGRRASTKSIATLVEQEIATLGEDSNMARILQAYNGNSMALAGDMFGAFQVVLEFLDKGMKGLLSGDLSTYAIKEIQSTIEKSLPKMENIQAKMQRLIESETNSLGSYYDEKLGISGVKEQTNQPVYSAAEIEDLDEQLRDQLNVQNHMIKRQLQISDEVEFVSRTGPGAGDKKPAPKFESPQNMQRFLNKNLDEESRQIQDEEQTIRIEEEAKLQQLEDKLNKVINAMYNDLARKLFKLDKFILPVHGILRPDQENPMNLFKR